MSSEQICKFSKFAWFTIALLILIGGTRTAIHVRGSIQFFSMDHASQLARSIKACEKVFLDSESYRPNDRIQSEEAYPHLPKIVPESQSRCQTWAKNSQHIGENFFVTNMVLWIFRAFLGVSTLLVAFGMIKRSHRVGSYMLWLFGIQTFSAGAEIVVSILVSVQNKKLLLALWPDLQAVPFGWTFLYGEMVMTILGYTALCLIYFWLLSRLRSEKMWAQGMGTQGMGTDMKS